MVYLNTAFSQHYTPDTLPAAVRAALGKPLRRAAVLTQLALVGAFAALPPERRDQGTILLWQSTSGPRLETVTLLDEVCTGSAEPMPYDFLATQPALAAAQIQPFLPGLRAANHLPLDNGDSADWCLLLTLACEWLRAGRCTQVLCAQLDHGRDMASGHWLAVSSEAAPGAQATLTLRPKAEAGALTDTPDLPARLNEWLSLPVSSTVQLQSPATSALAVEFARL